MVTRVGAAVMCLVALLAVPAFAAAPVGGITQAPSLPTETAPMPPAAPLRSPVRAAPLVDAPDVVGVQVVARSDAVIGAPMAGRLRAFPLRDGDRFEQGEVIARFVCAQIDGMMARATATLGKKQQQLNIAARLRQLGTNNLADYSLAAAEVREAQADLGIAQANQDNCTVIAPFTGRVGNVMTRNHEFVAAGAPLLELIGDQELELELILPSRWLVWLKPGVGFEVRIQETGQSYRAEIVRISGKVDSVSQSIKAYGRIHGPVAGLLAGMSGQATLTPPTQ